eukprot:6316404-Heterocapsa_arctica.AAC.1
MASFMTGRIHQHIVDHPLLGVLAAPVGSREPLTYPCKLRDERVVLNLLIVSCVDVHVGRCWGLSVPAQTIRCIGAQLPYYLHVRRVVVNPRLLSANVFPLSLIVMLMF